MYLLYAYLQKFIRESELGFLRQNSQLTQCHKSRKFFLLITRRTAGLHPAFCSLLSLPLIVRPGPFGTRCDIVWNKVWQALVQGVTKSGTWCEKVWVGSGSVPDRLRVDSESIPGRYQVDSGSIPSRFRVDSRSIPSQFRVDSELIPGRFQVDSRSIPGRFLVDPGRSGSICSCYWLFLLRLNFCCRTDGGWNGD